MTRRATGLFVLRVVSVLLSAPAGADAQDILLPDNEPARAAKDGKVLRAFRITDSGPRIDGLLDDEVWRFADVAEGFTQWDPDNMKPMTEQTQMQVAYDDRYLYVAVRCLDRTSDDIARGLGRRDEGLRTDNFSLGFDPRHDHLTGYVFQTNPSGVQTDMYLFDDENTDTSFDSVWEVRTAITNEGWSAEFRIPFSQMRFQVSPTPGQMWGFSGRRNIRRRAEMGEWIGRPRGERGNVSRWGHLIFDEPLKPPRRIELQPYLLGSSEYQPARGDDLNGSIGLDLRMGIGTGATLSATINPDFGQVELDPAVLNLTVFETFFPEKRPFFLEDSRTFVPPYGLFQLFHSRRIGRLPDRFAVPSEYRVVGRPDQTTVLGAAKLTGKGSGWTYGAQSALTAREYATVESIGTAAASRRRYLIEPLTSYNAVRIQRDIRAGSSNIGALVTGVVREKAADAFTGGFDYTLRWDRNRVSWNGHWVATRAPGPGGVKTGAGGVTNFNFTRKHYNFFSHADHFGEDFRVTDIGFFRSRANRTQIDGGFTLEQPDPWKIFRFMGVQSYTGTAFNTERLVFDRWAGAAWAVTFRNYLNINGNVQHSFQVFDDLDTRGGPPIVRPAGNSFNLFVNSDSRKSWRTGGGVNGRRDAVGGWEQRLSTYLNLQPSGRLQVSMNGGFTSGKDNAQWITNRDINGDGVTDHVYGTLRRNILDVTIRTTYAIHRDMTFQLFMQPFVAVGDYENIRRLARPKSYDFEPGDLSFNPDFNRKSLRSNAVLRWEYVRGSTLFVVWNMSRSDTSRPGVFGGLRDLGDAFGGDGPRVFMVKVSYWMAR